jgi:acetyl esterase/lipase
MRKVSVFLLTFIMNSLVMAQSPTEVIKLYKKVPGAKQSEGYKEQNIVRSNGTSSTTKVTAPTLSYFKPTVVGKSDAAVIICPGGGYGALAISHEGYDVAKKFTDMGVSAFVLKYRLPSDEIMENKTIGPLQDAQQALKLVRENAAKYGINPAKIGIMGFSAGGHLAATASTHFKREVIENKNGTSLRPGFSILIYPVVTFGDATHKGSKTNLIGANAAQELVDLYSNEKQVTAETPITFIVHANDDKAVPVDNSLNYIKALNKSGVKNEAHLYPGGGHGFGLNNKTTKDVWFDRLITWMSDNDFLKH